MKIVLFSPNNPDQYMMLLMHHRFALAQTLAAKDSGADDPQIAVRVMCDLWEGIIVAAHPGRCAFSILVTNDRS
jgi:hypothetical protein